MVEEPLIVELPPKFHLNQSRWKLYMDCPRLYGWENVEGIVPDRPRKPLVIGSAIHKAQVAIHQKNSTPDAIAEGVQVAEKYVRDNMKTAGPQLPTDQVEIEDASNTVKRLLPAYYQHWGKLGQVWKPLGQELAFCVEVGEGTNVFLVGTIDNLVTLNGSLWMVDYKTMGKLDMREFIKYEIDIQPTAYLYGGTKQLTLNARAQGKPPVVIRGIIIDGLVKTATPQFHRELYTRSVDDFREFELEFCMKAWEMASKHAMVRGDKKAYDLYCEKMYSLGTATSWKTIFPKNTQQCFRYGTCADRELCIKDTPVRRMAFRKREPDYVDDAAAGRTMRTEKP